MEVQALDAAELVVGEGLCPATNLGGVVDGNNDVVLHEFVVHEAGLGAELTRVLQEAWSERLVDLCDHETVIDGENKLVDPDAYLRRKLEEVRLLVVDGGLIGSSLVIKYHGAALRVRVERMLGVVCCVFCSQAGGD
jgi:hypothetical protein